MDDEDHYETLGVPYESSEKEIATAYRRAALKCHPDKAGDDPVAAALFLKLTKAYDVLSDPERKANYDALLKAKLAKKQKMAQLDAGRRKMASDLAAREFHAREKRYTDAMEAARQKAEIERLREEGLAKIAKMEEETREKAEKAVRAAGLKAFLAGNENDPPGTSDIDRTLKLRWRVDDQIGGEEKLNEASLRTLLGKFGLIAHLLVSPPKEGKKKPKASAIVQYAQLGFAMDAMDSFEKKEASWPAGLEVEWAFGGEPAAVEQVRAARAAKQQRTKSATPEPHTIKTSDEPFAGFSFSGIGNGSKAAELPDEDYEAETLRKMRERAEARERERKRILEEDEREDREAAEREAKKQKADGQD